MLKLDSHPSGRHFLHVPGPSPVPARILRAISFPPIDHRGPEFGQLGLKVLFGIQQIFKTLKAPISGKSIASVMTIGVGNPTPCVGAS